MAQATIRHKHYLLDQNKITQAKMILKAATEKETIETALNLILYQDKMHTSLKKTRGQGNIEKIYD